MPMRRFQIAIVSVLGVALLAAAVAIIYQSRKLADVRQQRDTALQSLQETREELRKSQLRLSAALRKPPKPANIDKATIAQRDARIAQLTQQLSAAQASVTQVQEELSAAKDENEKKLASSSQHYQKLQAEMQDQLDKLQKALSSAQASVQDSHRRITDLEEANAKLEAEGGKESTRAAEREHILTRLQDLDRRRETYLRSIGDRYRNITTQFRTISGMLDSDRGQASSNAFSGTALGLIQNALSQCDNDFQHLSDLNAKAFQLEKKLSRK